MNNRKKIEDINRQISERKNMLSAQSSDIGDWKLMKQFEAIMQGLSTPYSDEDMQIYHTARAKVRKEINELEAQLAEEVK